jgi:NAD-dependent dihydropyrimidine dehydrogenase PreA subunit
MVVEIDVEKCTGCDQCTRSCPTAAFTLRDRLPSEPGKSRKIVELDKSACLNAQRCLEFCLDDALRMVELEEPFEVGIDASKVDEAAIDALCAKAGFAASVPACVCTGTTVGEMAAAVLLGADTPEKLSLATGARTGCSEICMHPFLAVLAAAGHADAPKAVNKGYQWYSKTATLFEQLGADGKYPQDLLNDFPEYRLQQELADLGEYSRAAAGGKFTAIGEESPGG